MLPRGHLPLFNGIRLIRSRGFFSPFFFFSFFFFPKSFSHYLRLWLTASRIVKGPGTNVNKQLTPCMRPPRRAMPQGPRARPGVGGSHGRWLAALSAWATLRPQWSSGAWAGFRYCAGGGVSCALSRCARCEHNLCNARASKISISIHPAIGAIASSRDARVAPCTTHRHSTTAMPNAAWRQRGSCIFITHAQPACFRQLSSHSKSHFKKCQSNFVSLSNAPQAISHTRATPHLLCSALTCALLVLANCTHCLPHNRFPSFARLSLRGARALHLFAQLPLPCDLHCHATIATIAKHHPSCTAVFACCYAWLAAMTLLAIGAFVFGVWRAHFVSIRCCCLRCT